jgi:hypothetical protein
MASREFLLNQIAAYQAELATLGPVPYNEAEGRKSITTTTMRTTTTTTMHTPRRTRTRSAAEAQVRRARNGRSINNNNNRIMHIRSGRKKGISYLVSSSFE